MPDSSLENVPISSRFASGTIDYMNPQPYKIVVPAKSLISKSIRHNLGSIFQSN